MESKFTGKDKAKMLKALKQNKLAQQHQNEIKQAQHYHTSAAVSIPTQEQKQGKRIFEILLRFKTK